MSAPTFSGTAVITGAAGGIGAATAVAFAAAGCTKIAITDISSLETTKKDILSISDKISVFAKTGDIRSEDFVNAFIDKVSATFTRLDYIVNCAGVLQQGVKTGNDLDKGFARTSDTSLEQFDFVNGVNYKGTWLVSRAALRKMLTQEPVSSAGDESWRGKSRGSIVNIASQLGVVSRAGAPVYCASKSAIIGLTRADAIDYSKDLIRINCVCPGVINTQMTTGSPEVTEAMEPAVKIAPMGRMGDPREVADAVLFLSSSRASFVQGHALVVDGGYVIN
ncbi:oxidoreductase [Aspergillus unguis]